MDWTIQHWIYFFFGSLIWVYIASRLWHSGLIITITRIIEKILSTKQIRENKDGNKK